MGHPLPAVLFFDPYSSLKFIFSFTCFLLLIMTTESTTLIERMEPGIPASEHGPQNHLFEKKGGHYALLVAIRSPCYTALNK